MKTSGSNTENIGSDLTHRHASNRKAWDQASTGNYYQARRIQALMELRAGRNTLHKIEIAQLGELLRQCALAVHLQCGIGDDTISLRLLGAKEVVGVDISEGQINTARTLATDLGIPANWYCCDVLDCPSDLNGKATLVYTGKGALNWIHDLDRWADVVSRILRPGGYLYVWDSHPVKGLFWRDAERLAYNGESYFYRTITEKGWPPNFLGNLGKSVDQLSTHYRRVWTFGEFFRAMIKAGFIIKDFAEHAEDYWDAFPSLIPEEAAKIPKTFSLTARRP